MVGIDAKTFALPLPGHIPTTGEVALLAGVGVEIAEGGGVVVAGILIGTRALSKRVIFTLFRLKERKPRGQHPRAHAR